MWFTRLSIQRPVFVVVFMLTILVLGVRSEQGLNIDQNPPINYPVVTVLTQYPGVNSEEVETSITKPIEDSVSSIARIEHITSSSQYGTSYVMIQFEIGVDALQAQNEVREKVDAARGALPKDVDPPTVVRFDFTDLPVITAGIKTDLSLKQAKFEATKVIEPLLSQVDGVSPVDIAGGDTREIAVQVDRDRLAAYGISIGDVVNAVEAANLNVSAGHITEGRHDFDARVIGEFQSVDQIRNVHIPIPSKDPTKPLWVPLSSLATVQDTVAERTDMARMMFRNKNGKLVSSESVSVVVSKNTDANTVKVADGVKAVFANLEKTLPGNTHFVINSDQSTVINDQLRDIMVALVSGAGLAILVVFFFLHDIRGTFMCAVAIPLSLIATFIPMYFAGFTLNSMTMLALSLVVGILVDDSIVVLENVYRHLRRGEQPAEAAYNGRSEIGLAAIAITMVDVAVFLPMAWMGGVVGMFFRQFGLVVACATLFSLIVSFSVTPMLASRLYHGYQDVEDRDTGVGAFLERQFHRLDMAYHRGIAWALRHRFIVLTGGIATLAVVLLVAGPKLGFQFAPTTDQGQLILTCEMPQGTSLTATSAVMEQVEHRLTTIPEVDSTFTSIGTITGASQSAPQLGPQLAQLTIRLEAKPPLQDSLNPFYDGPGRKRSDTEIADQIRKLIANIPGPRFVVIPVGGFSGTAAPIDLEVLGFDLNHMEKVATELKNRIAKIPGIMNPDISMRPGKPEADIIVDRDKAAAFGYSVAQIGDAVKTAFAGNTDSKYRDRGDQFDIDIKLRDLDRTNIQQIGDLIVGSRGSYGDYQPVYLRDVANIQMGSGPTQIDRIDRQRVVHVTAYLAPGAALGNVQGLINKQIQDVPAGAATLKWGGQAEQMGKEFGYLFGSLALSIILVYLLMAALFDSLLYPLIIQFSMPMALIGAVLGLVIADKPMSIIAMIGVIMLVGLVQKNAILLIDYTNTLRARGLARNEAVQQAGATRLRPILMTTVAMVFGMLPVAAGVGTASEARSPLADCVIGGLLLSTVLTLVMIPVIYTLVDDFVRWVRRLFGREEVETRTRIRRSPESNGHGAPSGNSLENGH